MNNNSHQNSRIITIFRSNNFVQQAQSPDSNEQVADWMALSAKNIGPYFQSHTARIIGSGLTLAEQALLLPFVINIPSTDPTFPKAVSDFFNGLVTKVPFTGGQSLQIGLETSNEKELSKDNLPLAVEDYIRWRHAKNHPWVAGSMKEANGNQLKYFYMEDPELQLKEETDKLVIQDKADSIWLQIKDQQAKVSMLLTLMGKDEREYVGLKNADARRRNDLRTAITKDPVRFLKIYEDERFETRYWLKAMVNANVVKQVGTAYVWGDNNTLIGKSELETLLFLEDTAKAETVMLLKSMTQDVLKKPKNTGRNKKVNA